MKKKLTYLAPDNFFIAFSDQICQVVSTSYQDFSRESEEVEYDLDSD